MGLMLGGYMSLYAQNLPEKSEDYKKWSLEQLLFTIDSGLLDRETRLEYIEFYLQKAKKENAVKDVVVGYKKKITNLENQEIIAVYADSLISFAKQINDKQIIGIAYENKSYVEYVAKNYENALDFGLKAEKLLEEVEDFYRLNKIRSYIGAIYYHLEEYQKAYKFYNEVKKYYKYRYDDSYNNLRGYINSLYGLGKSAYQLQKYDTLEVLIKEGYVGIRELKTHDQALEIAYFSMLDGMYHHVLQEYHTSDSLLKAALPYIQENNDFANAHLVYLYLGKNAWESNKKKEALGYFEKINELYQEKNFMNSELSEAYTYLIDYYKEQKDTEKQLYYTDQLLQISKELQAKNRNLSNYLHENLDTKRLEASKVRLKNELAGNKKWSKSLYAVIALLVILMAALGLGYRKSKKKFQKKYNQLVEKGLDPEEAATPEILDTDQILLDRLVNFEERKGFLQKITLEELAVELMTNRTTLSQLLNEHKGGFKQYLKKLRINYAIRQIQKDPGLRQLNFDALAEEFGFGSGKSLSVAFKEMTDLSLFDFVKMSEKAADDVAVG